MLMLGTFWSRNSESDQICYVEALPRNAPSQQSFSARPTYYQKFNYYTHHWKHVNVWIYRHSYSMSIYDIDSRCSLLVQVSLCIKLVVFLNWYPMMNAENDPLSKMFYYLGLLLSVINLSTSSFLECSEPDSEIRPISDFGTLILSSVVSVKNSKQSLILSNKLTLNQCNCQLVVFHMFA